MIILEKSLDVTINGRLLTQEQAVQLRELVISATEFGYHGENGTESIYDFDDKKRAELLDDLEFAFTRAL